MAQQLGQMAVGSVVQIKEDGYPIPYIIVHQGKPSSSYDDSCNGTWLLRQNIIEERNWNLSDSNVLETSSLQEWLNNQKLDQYDTDIQAAIKQVKIPYRQNGGEGGTDQSGANGLNCKVFLLSAKEVGFTDESSYFPNDGTKLDYFLSGTGSAPKERRVATMSGSSTSWWLRSQSTRNTYVVWGVGPNGGSDFWEALDSRGVRNAFILPSTLSVDGNGNVITNSAPTAPTSISVPGSANKGGSVAVSWVASTDAESNLSGYTLQRSVNGGGFTQVYQGANTSYTDTAPTNADTLQYRVQAYDAMGATSGWTTSDQFPVYGVPTLSVSPMVMQGQQATINWSAIEGADSYTLQRKSSADADWTQVYSGANLSYTETVGTWTSLQYRVQAVFDGTPGGWATSDPIQIVSASALVISGQDGDLGTLVNDVPYSISSDQTSPTIDVTVEVNGGEYASFQATSGQTYKVGVLDLPTGTGSIVITASTEVSSSPVSVTRTWTYSKTAQTFPNAGGVAQLTKEGAVIWPKTLDEAVRAAMNPWGGNLGTALNLLKNAALFNRTKQPKYSEVTIDLSTLTKTDAQNGKIINLPVNGVMVPHRVVHIGNPDSELYDSSCDGVWVLRIGNIKNGKWNESNENTLPNSTIMQTMSGYLADYDSALQSAIKTVKIPYCIGNGSSSVNSGANGLECKVFPLSAKEVGLDEILSSAEILPTDGAKLDYYLSGDGDEARAKRAFSDSYFLRTPRVGADYTSYVAYIGPVPAPTISHPSYVGATAEYKNIPAFILPTTFSAGPYYVATDGTIHASQEYTEAGDWLDVWGNAIPAVKLETGSYTGTGTSGSSNPNTLTFPFTPKIVFIAMQDGSQGISGRIFQSFPWIYGTNQGVASYGEDQIEIGINNLSWDGTTLKWYSSAGSLVGADYQLNKNGVTYLYVAIG